MLRPVALTTIGVALLATLALYGSSTPPKVPERAAVAAPTQVPTPLSTLVPTPTEVPVDTARTRLLRAYFQDAYGTGTLATSWYKRIQSLEVRDGRVEVRTSYDALDQGRERSSPICLAVSIFAYSAGGVGVSHASVYDGKGILLYPECVRQPKY